MKTLRILTLMALVIPCAAYAYSGDDNSDRLSSGSSAVFSSGYINAAKQKTETMMAQLNPKKSFTEKLMENIKNSMSGNVDKAANTKVTADVKKKDSSKQTRTNARSNTIEATANTNIEIGTGSDQEYDPSGLIAEFFDGKRHVYAGFDSVGKNTIQSAINYAASKAGGGNVIVRGWSSTDPNARNYNEVVTLADGVSLFGGYGEDGARNITGTKSTITQYISVNGMTTQTEINGFNLATAASCHAGIYVNNSSGIITIVNNNFDDGFTGPSNARVLLKNNTFINAETLAPANGGTIESTNNNYNSKMAFSPRNGGRFTSDHDYFGGSYWIPCSSSSYVSITNPTTALNDQTRGTTLIGTSSQTTDQRTTLLKPYSYNSPSIYGYDSTMYLESIGKSGLTLGADTGNVSSIFKGLLESKANLMTPGTNQVDPDLLRKLVNKSLEESGLSESIDKNSRDMDLAAILADIA